MRCMPASIPCHVYMRLCIVLHDCMCIIHAHADIHTHVMAHKLIIRKHIFTSILHTNTYIHTNIHTCAQDDSRHSVLARQQLQLRVLNAAHENKTQAQRAEKAEQQLQVSIEKLCAFVLCVSFVISVCV